MKAASKMNALPKTEAIAVTKRNLAFPALWTVVGLLVGGALAASGCGSQRRVACAPVANDFAVKLTLVAGSKTGMGDCDMRFDGSESVQTMGTQPYFNEPGKSRINHLAITPAETGNYVHTAASLDPPVDDDGATHHPFAFGTFTTESPDNQNICHIDSWSNPAEAQFDKGFKVPPEGGGDDGGADDGGTMDGGAPSTDGGAKDGGASTDAGAPMSMDAGGGADAGMCPMQGDEPPQTDFPPLHVKYDFGAMRLYVTPALTGSIFAADLTYTSFTGGTCSAKFKLRGVSPSVSCADECGKPNDDLCHDPENGIPQPDWDAEAKNPASAYKNINAIYTVCDHDSLTCVLDPKDPHIPQ